MREAVWDAATSLQRCSEAQLPARMRTDAIRGVCSNIVNRCGADRMLLALQGGAIIMKYLSQSISRLMFGAGAVESRSLDWTFRTIQLNKSREGNEMSKQVWKWKWK